MDEDNTPFFNLPSLKCENKFDLDKFLDADVDLGKFFNKKELDEMGPHQRKRYKNIAQNFEIMSQMGLPAVKPDFMKGPAFRARKVKMRQKSYAEPSSESNSDNEEWTPDMESKKRKKEQRLLAPKVKYPDLTEKLEPSQKSSKKSAPRKREVTSTDACEEPEKKVYSFRDHTQVTNFMNLEPPDDDHFLYCEECNKEYDMDCPVHGPLTYIKDTPVADKVPDRALHTLPEGLVVKESGIPGAGLGVFAEKYIPARTKFGYYGGVTVTNPDLAHSSGYCWQIYKDGKPSHFVDAFDKEHSNWMRYVNCAINETEQNLVAFQHEGRIYYRTFKPIVPSTELLVYYGDEYARDLGVCRDENAFIRPKYVMGTVCYPCMFCRTSFTSAGACVFHLLRSHGARKLCAGDIRILDEWLRRKALGKYKVKVDTSKILCIGRNDGTCGKENLTLTTYSRNKYNKNQTQLAPHVRTNTGEKPWCDVCEYASSEKGVLVNHMRTHTGEKPYKCDVCEYASSQKGDLVRHMRTHTGEKPYKCDVCEYASRGKSDLVNHMRTHTGEKPYKCDVCEYASSEKGHLVNHMRTHTGEKPYKCDVCEYASSVKCALVNHMRTHTGEKPYKCDVCKYASSQKGDLVRHMRTHTGEKPYKCDVCEYASRGKSDLVNHMRTHTGEKPYKCDVCEYASSEKGHLVKHMRTHTGEKPYKCDVCEYASSQKGDLVRHMRTHTGEKPYKCDVCEYASRGKSDLVNHMRTHTGEKPYKCDVCEYASSEKGHLVNHMRTHTGEKPYKCDVCEYASSVKCALVNHMRTHTGEKPYKCDVCKYASSEKGHLVKHMRTHTGEKPYKCDVCKYASSEKGHLVKHMRTHTGEKPYKCDVCEYAGSQKGPLVRHMRTHTVEKLVNM